ncbi:rhomboid family intramembrane serine protease [Streptococcus parauberis]|uniref:Peptidase, S54 family n=2 Tax=Streptococcus parauberis TaxID=1348 RepID=F1Z274_9STRE|nr:rhomboid family intramembrane serine protease [Streptococcus parauberis]EGE53754.1 peptidase, S54 family [Streptococcus parauberis NCFD 2020]PCH13754.1 Rhomboid protease GluP [Streptococcus parauberis]RFE00992.1 Rhomboid protease GluP [Streptococcus parauberis]
MIYDLRKNPVTLTLLILTALVFLAMQVFYGQFARSVQAIYQFGGMYGVAVKALPSQLWRLVSAIFVHIGWEHFLLNGLTLVFVGQLSEKLWGARHFLLLYLLSGIMGNLFVLAFTPSTVAAGASTSLFGLFAAITVLGYFSQNLSLKALSKSYQSLIFVNLLMNIFMPNVSIAGHIGGIVGGALAALFLPSQAPENQFERKYRLASLALYVFLVVAILTYTYLT